MAVRHRDVVLAQMKELGLRLNAKKSVLSPLQRTTYLGVVWDSTTMQAWLSPARIESILTTVRRVREGLSLMVKQFQKTAGSDGSCVQRDTFWPAVHETPTLVAQVQGVLPEGKPVSHDQGHVTLATDASLTGWGAVMSGHPARGLWSGHHLTWHINCLEMLAVFRALKHFLPDLRNHNVLVCTDNTAVVSYINHQGGPHSRPLYKLAHQILVWSQDKFLSLRAVYIPGNLNVGADILSRQGPRPGEWRLHPEVVKQIWRVFGQAQVDLFATHQTLHCPLWYSLTHPAPLPGSSRESVPGWSPAVASSPILAGPSMVLGPGFSPQQLSMGDSSQEGSPLTGGGYDPLPPPGVMEAMGVAPALSYIFSEESWGSAGPFGGPSFLDFAPGLSKAFLYPRAGYVPKVPSSVPWPVVLQVLEVLLAFCPPPFREPDQEKLNCMCPVQALDAYVHRTVLWRKTDQLLVCYGPPKKGLPASKQTLSRIVDAIIVAYESSDLLSPLGVKAHSTRGMAASKAFLAGVPIQDICDAAGLSTPLTFVRFYNLDLQATPGSSVLLP